MSKHVVIDEAIVCGWEVSKLSPEGDIFNTRSGRSIQVGYHTKDVILGGRMYFNGDISGIREVSDGKLVPVPLQDWQRNRRLPYVLDRLRSNVTPVQEVYTLLDAHVGAKDGFSQDTYCYQCRCETWFRNEEEHRQHLAEIIVQVRG